MPNNQAENYTTKRAFWIRECLNLEYCDEKSRYCTFKFLNTFENIQIARVIIHINLFCFFTRLMYLHKLFVWPIIMLLFCGMSFQFIKIVNNLFNNNLFVYFLIICPAHHASPKRSIRLLINRTLVNRDYHGVRTVFKRYCILCFDWLNYFVVVFCIMLNEAKLLWSHPHGVSANLLITIKLSIYDWSAGDYGAITSAMQAVDWHVLFGHYFDANSMWQQFKNIIWPLIDQYVPKK